MVIATPSALHAEQAARCLARGVAVFCQKPLARTAGETGRIVAAARAADRLLGVDLSYRHTLGMQRLHALVASGALGGIHAVDLVFHNAYGPDKAWFRDTALSGGGCVVDLGAHLVDLALWTLDYPAVRGVSSRLFARGTRLRPRPTDVEDYAIAELDLACGAVVRLACSWNLPVRSRCVIEACVPRRSGGRALRNVGGSFYDFVAERFDGRRRTALAGPPDAWRGRAAARLGAATRRATRASTRCGARRRGRRPCWTRIYGPLMRPKLLMTADTVGGVLTMRSSSPACFRPKGVEVHLATMGAPTTALQRARAARDTDSHAARVAAIAWNGWTTRGATSPRPGGGCSGCERTIGPDVVH